MRRIVITAVVMGLGAAVPAAAAAPTTDYSGTTAQGKSVALTLSKQGTAKSLKSFKIAWDAPCRGTSFVFHASARLTGVDVTGGRFAGHTRSEAPAGANRIAHLRLHLRGAFAKGGGKATGRWRGPVRIANRKGTTVLTCKSGLVRFTAERE